MEVTYRMSAGDRLRCSLYASTHQPSTAGLHLVNLVLLTLLILFMISKHSAHPLTVSTAILLILLSLGGYVAYNAGMLFLVTSMRSRYASTQRMSTTSISSEGVHDVTSMTDVLLSWNTIKAIRYHHGDIHFWKLFGSVVVPRSAFQDVDEAQRFYQTALGFWCDCVARGGSSFVQQMKPTERLIPRDPRRAHKQTLVETLLWNGHPQQVPFGKRLANDVVKAQAINPIIGSLVFFTSIVVLSYGAPRTGAETLWGFMLFSWVGLAGCYYLSALSRENEAQYVTYEITDQRISKITPQKMRSSAHLSLALTEIDRIKIRMREAGVGTVEFGTTTNSYMTFNDISDPATVAQVFTNACEQQMGDVDALFAMRRTSDPFQSVLRHGESVLWQGQPKWSSYVNAHCGLRGGGTYLLLAGWLMTLAALDFSNVKPLWQQIAVIIPATLTAGYILIRRTQKWVQSATQTFYAVTNQRLLLVDKSRASVFASVDLARLQAMQFELFRSGVGTFSFGGKEINDVSFQFVMDPIKVRQVITEAKHYLSNTDLEWFDSVAVRAKKPKLSVEECLGVAFISLILFALPALILHSSYYTIRYYNPGMRHYQRGEYAAAITDLRIATNATPNEQAPYYLGLALMHEGRPQEARRAFERAENQAFSGRGKDIVMWNQAQMMIEQIDAAQPNRLRR